LNACNTHALKLVRVEKSVVNAYWKLKLTSRVQPNVRSEVKPHLRTGTVIMCCLVRPIKLLRGYDNEVVIGMGKLKYLRGKTSLILLCPQITHGTPFD
jgi:hypothetical protein